jgi:hypothetical protein
MASSKSHRDSGGGIETRLGRAICKASEILKISQESCVIQTLLVECLERLCIGRGDR